MTFGLMIFIEVIVKFNNAVAPAAHDLDSGNEHRRIHHNLRRDQRMVDG